MSERPGFYHEQSPALTDAHETITPREALERIRSRAARLDDHARPLVVFDLDGTLFDNRIRSQRIMAHLAEQGMGRIPEDVRRMIVSLPLDRMHYGVTDTLRSAGVDDKDVHEYMFNGWFERFFTNEWVKQDIPTSGAVDFVKQVHETRATVVYMTGRDTPNMREGTLDSLREHDFPIPDGKSVELITKPSFDTADLEFKQGAIQQLRDMGEVIATFDNEPKMNNTLARAFPDALHVFLDSLHSSDWELLQPDIVVLTDFDLNS